MVASLIVVISPYYIISVNICSHEIRTCGWWYAVSQLQWLNVGDFWGVGKLSKYSDFRREHFTCLSWLPREVNQTFLFSSLVELMESSKKTYNKHHHPGLLLPELHPCGKPLLTQVSPGDLPTLAGRSASVSYEVTALTPGSWFAQGFVCALQEWGLCFLQACGCTIIEFYFL